MNPSWIATRIIEVLFPARKRTKGLLFEIERKNGPPPFDRLRANGSRTALVRDFPFVLSLSKHERRSSGTSHLGKLYYALKWLERLTKSIEKLRQERNVLGGTK